MPFHLQSQHMLNGTSCPLPSSSLWSRSKLENTVKDYKVGMFSVFGFFFIASLKFLRKLGSIIFLEVGGGGKDGGEGQSDSVSHPWIF